MNPRLSLGQSDVGAEEDVEGDADAGVAAASVDVVIDDLDETVEESFIPVKWSAKEDDNPEEIQKIMIHQVSPLPFFPFVARFNWSNQACYDVCRSCPS